MGLNRMMMMRVKKGNGEDGSKFWGPDEVDGKKIVFTVPPGIKRIKVFAEVYYAEGDPDIYFYASIQSILNSNKVWGEGGSATNDEAENVGHQDINSIVGVTPNKTYLLHCECAETSGVTFSWGQAINDMPPTVEDY